jgi:DNA replication and repair protein RecF
MFLRSLSVVNFKNIREANVEFSPRLNTFIGDNGAGKTNLLDALYSLSFSKSYFNASDQLNLMHNESFFMLQGKYERKDNEETIMYGYQNGQKKQIKRNGKLYSRMSEHIGLFPLVMVSPADASLILGGSDERRKFMDGVISQYNAAYLEDLLRYNRILLQRNNLLKQYTYDDSFRDMLDIYDTELVEAGKRIHRQRINFIEKLIPVFQKYYSTISGGGEEVGLHYVSDLDEGPFEMLLSQTVANDKAAQYTTSGIHKDDLVLKLGGYHIKKLGSQGQQKSYLISLKLAQFEFICTISGIKPILLLDDIFDKLDKKRVEQIVKIVSGERFGQIFITDTNRDHLDSILHTITPEYRIYLVVNGNLSTIR